MNEYFVVCRNVGVMDAIMDILPRTTLVKAHKSLSKPFTIVFMGLTASETAVISKLSERFGADFYEDINLDPTS